MNKSNENKINAIASVTAESAKQFIIQRVKEETGKDIRVTSLEPLEYEVLTESILHVSIMLRGKDKNHKVYIGENEFKLHCYEFGFTTYDFMKEVDVNNREFQLVGFLENTQSKYLVLRGARKGLWVKKYEK